MNTDYRESAEQTGLHSLFDTFAYRRDVFLRNRTADYSRLELECLLAVDIHRLELNFTVSVLTTTTGLFCILAVHVNRFCDGLFVSNLRCTYVCLYLELTQKSVYDDLQVELAHTGDDRLSCLRISVRAECRVLLCKFRKRLTQFALGSLCLRLDRELDNRLRELHGLQGLPDAARHRSYLLLWRT